MVQGVRTIIVIAVTLVLISFFVGVVVTWLSNRHVVKPLSQLSEEVARIGREGDWKARLPSSSSRELASLSDNFNQMLTQLVLAHRQEQEMAAQEKKARERAESEIRKRADYTRALVHELKTPLTAISASIQLLNEEVTGTASTRLVSNIARGTANLTKRIDELLDLAKGEVGILGVNPAPMDARQLVYDLVGELKSIAIEKKLALDLVIPEGSIPAVLDGVRLRQILTNLIGNALKFTPEGGVIKVKVDKVDGDLIIAVTDNGPGIPPEEIPKIFEPYHRLSNIHGRLSGLGVGLAISRMLTELHGGSLTVDSLPGRGSTFRVSLPIAGTKADEQPD
jgi:signal transduction histidine kinase